MVNGRRTLCDEVCIPDAVYEVILQLTNPNPMLRASEIKDVSNVLRRFAEQMSEGLAVVCFYLFVIKF